MYKVPLLVLVALSVALSQSLSQFTANVVITNMPGLSGNLNGRFYFDGTRMRITYTLGPNEYIHFTDNIRYLTCGGSSCDAETITYDAPVFTAQPGEGETDPRTITVGGRTCTGYRRTSAGARQVRDRYASGNNLCRVVYGDGTTYTFTGNAALPGNWYNPPVANCPQPVCTKRIDFQLIFDESGSISVSEFGIVKQFGVSIANSFTWGVDHVQMGLTLFDTTSRLVVPLTHDKDNFVNTVKNTNRRGGRTCIPCGLDTGVNDLRNRGRTIPGTNDPVTRVFIFFTDGGNNERKNDMDSSIQRTRNNDIITFSVGVGGYNLNEITRIASDLTGVQTVFTKQNFDDLPQVLDQLTKVTCLDLPGNPCGPGCKGFCSCGGACICPDSCDDGNACTDDSCRIGGNGNGCVNTPTVCKDGNECTQDKCDPLTGCDFSEPTVCDDNNACTANLCSPATGCSYPNITCDDGNPCTANLCNPSTGCDFTQNAPCDMCEDKPPCPQRNCIKSECDNTDGLCKDTPLNCDDNSECTIDSCNPANGQCTYTAVNCDDGDACTIDTCDPATGCVNTPVVPSEYCDDHSVCTTDTCDKVKGCVNTPIVCDDGDPCTTNECSSLFGCYYNTLDCRTTPQFAGRDLGDCHVVICDAEQKVPCVLQLLPNTTQDECQVCNGDGSTCNQLDSNATAGIGGGLIAVIVIVAVAVVALLAAFGGKKGYDVWLSHRANMQGANTNPLYNNEGLSGTNPMYSEATH